MSAYSISGLLCAAFFLPACASSNTARPITESNLTAGMAKATITKGTTTQKEIVEVFGPPDLVTHSGDQRIWTYDKIRYDIESGSAGFTVLLAGASVSGTRSSSTSTMLIVYFDLSDVVVDYRMSVVRF